MAFKFKTGDEVKIIAGKDKGKVGKILKVIRSDSKVLVSGVNLSVLHKKATQYSDSGIYKKEAPLHISNISHFDSKTSQSSKISYKILDGKKVRVYKKTGNVVISERVNVN